jgi:hypothetical protein
MATMDSKQTSRMLTRHSYPFRLCDPVSGRAVQARFLAKLNDISDCYAAWEIVAPAHPEPETR